MPIVELSQEHETFELKSAPPDGYVTLRRMSHGEQLRRQDKSSRMSMNSRKRGRQAKVDDRMFIDTFIENLRHLDFALCIIDHNLEHSDGTRFDFKKKAEFDRLPPKIGEEIGEIIDEFNGFNDEDEDDLANSNGGGDVPDPSETPAFDSSAGQTSTMET